MCSIIASPHKEEFLDLMNANRRRGVKGCSIHTWGDKLEKIYEGVPQDTYDLPDDQYLIGHYLSPTGKVNNAHPCKIDQTYLWHNGMLKQGCMRDIRTDTLGDWDTAYIADEFNVLFTYADTNPNFTKLDGSFACLGINLDTPNEVFAFRNAISPLFRDQRTFSSVPFDGGESVAPNHIWRYSLASVSEDDVSNMGEFVSKSDHLRL